MPHETLAKRVVSEIQADLADTASEACRPGWRSSTPYEVPPMRMAELNIEELGIPFPTEV